MLSSLAVVVISLSAAALPRKERGGVMRLGGPSRLPLALHRNSGVEWHTTIDNFNILLTVAACMEYLEGVLLPLHRRSTPHGGETAADEVLASMTHFAHAGDAVLEETC